MEYCKRDLECETCYVENFGSTGIIAIDGHSEGCPDCGGLNVYAAGRGFVEIRCVGSGYQCAGGEPVKCGDCGGGGRVFGNKCKRCEGIGKICPTCHKPIKPQPSAENTLVSLLMLGNSIKESE